MLQCSVCIRILQAEKSAKDSVEELQGQLKELKEKLHAQEKESLNAQSELQAAVAKVKNLESALQAQQQGLFHSTHSLDGPGFSSRLRAQSRFFDLYTYITCQFLSRPVLTRCILHECVQQPNHQKASPLLHLLHRRTGLPDACAHVCCTSMQIAS
jgi:hypothetical protein